MAEHLSQENGDTLASVASPSKSPGKSRKITLGSLFKRSTADESGVRGSSKERGSSRSKKKKSAETAVEPNHDIQTRLAVSTEMGRNEEQRATGTIKENSPMHFKEFEEEELEQKSIGDLSSKKVQKRNKELSKQNNQLAKSVDALKKERVGLLSDKQKLKSENKTLERELRRVSSKGEVRLHKKSSQLSVSLDQSTELETMEDMSLKIQSLEARLAERDKKLKRVRERLQRISSEATDLGLPLESEESSRRESQTVPPEFPPNGGILDSSVLERLLDEKNKSSKLQHENSELKAKIVHLEAQMHAAKEGSEKARKRSGNFFRRNKAHSKSMTMRSSDEVIREREATKERDTQRSKSPDFLSMSDSFQDILTDPLSKDPQSVGSLPNFTYSGLSPHTVAKRAHGDIQTFQSCLKIALDEKKSLSEQIKQLESDLIAAREAIKKEKTLIEERAKALHEVESSRKMDKDKLTKQLFSLQQANKELKSEKLALEKQLAESATGKEQEVRKLKEEIKLLQVKLAESEKIQKESEDVFNPPTSQPATPKREVKTTKSVVTKPPVASTNQSKPPVAPTSQSKPSVAPTSQSKPPVVPTNQSKPPVAPTSQSKLSGKEGEAESKSKKPGQSRMRRRSSSSSLSSDEHYDSVANTRALFEQKIGSFRDDKQSPSRKTSVGSERRGSYSNAPPTLKPAVNHAKSSSFDASKIDVHVRDSTKRTEKVKSPTSPKKTEQKSPTHKSSTTVSTSTAATKPTSLNISKSTSGTRLQSFTSSNKETTPVSKVSKIIVKSTASPSSSPVLGRQNSTETTVTSGSLQKQVSLSCRPATLPVGSPVLGHQKLPEQQKTTTVSTRATVIQKQVSVPANMHKMSPTTPGVSMTPRTVSIDGKDVPVKVPTASTSSVKRTVVAPIRSGSTATTPTTPPTPVTPAKVTFTTSSTSTTVKSDTVVMRSNRSTKPRPQSMMQLHVPSSMKKASSLQDIPEQTSSESTIESAQPPVSVTPKKIETKKAVEEPVVVAQRNPTPRRFQRRERSDRPKTMYAGRAETTNLVNLISRFQQQEATNKEKENTSTRTTITPIKENKVVNGLSSPDPAPSFKVSTPSLSTSPGVVMRNSSSPRMSRPNSYYGAPTEKIVSVKSPCSPVSNKKPPPSARPLLRAQTVGSGLGINRQSKKAMLLRWCQRETMEYENVSIHNFDTSFSDGLAFCALIHHFLPDKIPYNTLNAKNRQHNFTLAFKVAEEAGIPSLLDVEDMVLLSIPDWMSVMTYVSFIYNKFGQPNNAT